MASVKLSSKAVVDLERIFDYLAKSKLKVTMRPTGQIRQAIEVLEEHPLMGRRVVHGRKELVFSRGRFGYVALYQWYEHYDSVLILSIKHRNEAGYVDE